jgi:enoyl-CoA hydratase/carnithine racemase
VTYDLPGLLVDKDGPVAIVTMNRPDQLNAFDSALHGSMERVWWQLGEDDDVRAVILTGAGKAFSAGGDVPGFQRTYESLALRRTQLRSALRLADEMVRFHKPVVGAINGPAVGLGCSTAVLCDLVLMSDKAYLADTHVAIGLVAGDGGAATWPLMTSILKAKELLFLGDKVSAEEAVRIGLANRAVPADELQAEALALAHRLAGLPAQALQETKRSINIHLQRAIHEVMPFALMAEGESFATDDLAETVRKFTSRG